MHGPRPAQAAAASASSEVASEHAERAQIAHKVTDSRSLFASRRHLATASPDVHHLVAAGEHVGLLIEPITDIEPERGAAASEQRAKQFVGASHKAGHLFFPPPRPSAPMSNSAPAAASSSKGLTNEEQGGGGECSSSSSSSGCGSSSSSSSGSRRRREKKERKRKDEKLQRRLRHASRGTCYTYQPPFVV